MLDIRPPHNKALALLEVNGTSLCLDDPTVFDNAYSYVDVFRGDRNAACDVQLIREIRTEVDDQRVIFP